MRRRARECGYAEDASGQPVRATGRSDAHDSVSRGSIGARSMTPSSWNAPWAVLPSKGAQAPQPNAASTIVRSEPSTSRPMLTSDRLRRFEEVHSYVEVRRSGRGERQLRRGAPPISNALSVTPSALLLEHKSVARILAAPRTLDQYGADDIARHLEAELGHSGTEPRDRAAHDRLPVASFARRGGGVRAHHRRSR